MSVSAFFRMENISQGCNTLIFSSKRRKTNVLYKDLSFTRLQPRQWNLKIK